MTTLAQLNLNNRIVRIPLDTSSIPMKSVISKLKLDKPTQVGTSNGQVHADTEAIHYYLLNHLIADLSVRLGDHGKLSSDEEKLVELYFTNVNKQAKRMFYYMLTICTRESRHIKSGIKIAIKDKLGKEDGEVFNEFLVSIKGKQSQSTVNHLISFPPKLSLGKFVTGLETVFFDGDFSGGYGGDAWGEIAKTLRKCVYGEMSLELMIDCAYNLSHNNGPIFNKGMWYTGYSNEFIKHLDVQRAGQMPIYTKELISYGCHDYINDMTKEIVGLGKQINPELFKGYTDWYLVEASGAVGSYYSEKKEQYAKYGDSPKSKELKEIEKKKQEEAKQKALEAEKELQEKLKDTLNFGVIKFNKTKMQRSE